MYIYIYMGDLQFQEVKEEQKNNEHLWTIEKVINDDIFAPEYEPPDEIFNRRKYMLTKKKIQWVSSNLHQMTFQYFLPEF